MFGGYARKVAEHEIAVECKAFQQYRFDRNPNNDNYLPEDYDARRAVQVDSVEVEAIENLEMATGAKVARGKIKSEMSIPQIDAMDDEMLLLLIDNEHVELLEAFSKQLGMQSEAIKAYVKERII